MYWITAILLDLISFIWLNILKVLTVPFWSRSLKILIVVRNTRVVTWASCSIGHLLVLDALGLFLLDFFKLKQVLRRDFISIVKDWPVSFNVIDFATIFLLWWISSTMLARFFFRICNSHIVSSRYISRRGLSFSLINASIWNLLRPCISLGLYISLEIFAVSICINYGSISKLLDALLGELLFIVLHVGLLSFHLCVTVYILF